MVHSLCLYQIILFADSRARADYPVSRCRIESYISHVCALLHCRLEKLCICNGCALLLVDLDADITISCFFDRLKLWTASWIMATDVQTDAVKRYWGRCCFRPISPEGKDDVSGQMEALSHSQDFDAAAYADSYRMVYYDDMADTLPMVCHHIIIITSRARLLLPAKYRFLLAEIAHATCSDMGIKVIQCGGMRNHMHILCYLPSNVSVDAAIDDIKCHLLENMHSNIHFRRFDGWSDEAVAYVTTRDRLHEEEGTVLKQDVIHRKKGYFNEMAYLYPKLGITFVAPLH